MVLIAQLVRALDCGSKGRGFESHSSPPLKKTKAVQFVPPLFFSLLCGFFEILHDFFDFLYSFFELFT